MTNLRDRVVEAGARAIANDRAEELDVWHFDDARAALDAMLDCLTENADEWDALLEQAFKRRVDAGEVDLGSPTAMFIAVLRNPE